jgi:hypothetical protein
MLNAILQLDHGQASSWVWPTISTSRNPCISFHSGFNPHFFRRGFETNTCNRRTISVFLPMIHILGGFVKLAQHLVACPFE